MIATGTCEIVSGPEDQAASDLNAVDPPPTGLATTRFPALGGEATVAVAEADRLALALDAVRRTADEFDRVCSRFRSDSELSALNAAAGRPVIVSDLLMEAVQTALRASRLTDGDVDPTVGPVLIALGYDRDFDAIAGHGCGASNRAQNSVRPRQISLSAVPGWQTVELDRAANSITLPRGLSLDLGATAKALAADHAAVAAAAACDCGALVSLSGDIGTAGEPPAEGWRVRVTDDHRLPDAPGQWIVLRSGGLATSSTTVRRWHASSGEAHHLIDPATGRPAISCWRTASVAAASCLDANTASTAAIIRSRGAVEWLQTLGLPARLVDRGGHATHLAGWPAEGDDLAA